LPPCGGEFSVSLATHHYFAGAALAELSQARADAATEIERAVALYEARPGPGEEHFFGTMTLTSWRVPRNPSRASTAGKAQRRNSIAGHLRGISGTGLLLPPGAGRGLLAVLP
jgi:hypothetical protein